MTELEAAYRPTGDFRLPHHSGSLLRGLLGRALRQTGCAISDEPCRAACLRPGLCTYSRLFDPPLPEPLPHRLLRGATEAPPPLLPLIPRPGETHADPLVLGVRVLGTLGDGDLQRLLAALMDIPTLRLGSAEDRMEIEYLRRRRERDRILEIALGEPRQGQLRVTFETPAWLTHKGRLHTAADLDFSSLFRHVYRRLTTLSSLYGELLPEDEARFPELDQLAASVQTAAADLRVVRWERHSWEREARHPMTGLLGSLLFDGPIGVFRPLLEAAALTFIGKSTSHGLGRMHIDVLDLPGPPPSPRPRA
ncbi:CRISPR system precrRNA processing endoribonuclease RAMP protein Cas6 [Sorangium cellulosum]|uniref:CRISPR system precrRNA processing endoribonuclease RAMP protein Cas6 n=1 Tax=Sorangium cellulosum TaxID=56 RepID=UPI00133170D9|nr:CRISPR system precrRNA processing endoribonuclease RAMP protein Cas6 [Sorangium cellulosum]